MISLNTLTSPGTKGNLAMPFSEPSHRDSWPPTIIRLREDDAGETDTIDENPFSFFLTTPEDDIEDDEDLSAGIESKSPKSAQVREISPSDIQRSPLPLDKDDEDDEEFGLAMPLTLKDFTRKHTNDGRNSRAGKRAEEELTGLGITIPISATRGRATVRLAPRRVGGGRGRARTLSARRPRSWRAPSPDLGSIKEERDSDEELKTGYLVVDETSASAPATTYIAQAAILPKPKKKVHWAL